MQRDLIVAVGGLSKNTGTRRVVEWVSTDEAEKRGT
jgi:hypothetical protein